MEYAYYGILFSLKMEEILSNVAPWMNLEDIMLSELSQSEKDKIVCSYLHELPGGIILIETESRMVIAKGWGWVEKTIHWELGLLDLFQPSVSPSYPPHLQTMDKPAGT